MDKKLEQFATEHKLSRAIIFDKDGKVIASTLKDVKQQEINALLKAFDSEETTIRSGITIDGHKFDVHRFFDKYEPPLIYGRRGLPQKNEGEGFAICKTVNSNTYAAPVFAVITFGFPLLTARAVPLLIKFCKENLA